MPSSCQKRQMLLIFKSNFYHFLVKHFQKFISFWDVYRAPKRTEFETIPFRYLWESGRNVRVEWNTWNLEEYATRYLQTAKSRVLKLWLHHVFRHCDVELFSLCPTTICTRRSYITGLSKPTTVETCLKRTGSKADTCLKRTKDFAPKYQSTGQSLINIKCLRRTRV